MSAFDELSCSDCGCLFGMPVGFLNNRRSDKRSFFCPNGHSMSYHESEADKLRRERDRLKQDQARLEQEASQAWATANEQRERAVKLEGTNKRLKKRASAGTCPCCNRTFANMSEHMKHQHPQFIAEGGAKVVPIKRMQSDQ